MLEKTSGKLYKNLEKDFENDIGDVNNVHQRHMQDKGDTIHDLDDNLNVLHQFKDTKLTRQEELERQFKRYENLKRTLIHLKRNGQREMDEQRQKLIEEQEKAMKELKDKAQEDAVKNISEIERNIQFQNQRLEDEALLQEYELEHL